MSKKKEGNPDKLDLMAREANKAGMSYGYWMATAPECVKQEIAWEARKSAKKHDKD